MGGKVAMQLALNWPERVQKLVVADISPVYYGGKGKGEHDDIFSGLNAIDLASIASRKEADAQLAKWEPDEIVRQKQAVLSGGLTWQRCKVTMMHYVTPLKGTGSIKGRYCLSAVMSPAIFKAVIKSRSWLVFRQPRSKRLCRRGTGCMLKSQRRFFASSAIFCRKRASCHAEC